MKYLSENIKKIAGKRVLLRLDLNEEVDAKGNLLDDYRLKSALPTIRLLQANNCKIIITSHKGRPNGQFVKDDSLFPAAKKIASLLRLKFVETDLELPKYLVKHLVFHRGDLTDQKVLQTISTSTSKDILVLENLRFYKQEEESNPEFAKKLSSLAEVFVNDAFAVCHRTSSSITEISKILPSYAGLQLALEMKNLSLLLNGKQVKPFVLLMGGIKISDKASTLQNLGHKADKILLGGGIANLFLAASGFEIGKSIVEKDSYNLAKQIYRDFKHKIILPTDVVVARDANFKNIQSKLTTNLTAQDSIYDIGPKTILNYSKELKTANTICWNGPLGYFEKKPFRAGTFALSKVIGGAGRRRTFALAGGGETVAAIRQSGQEAYFDHVSTGGGAMLEFLSGNKLPGLEALG